MRKYQKRSSQSLELRAAFKCMNHALFQTATPVKNHSPIVFITFKAPPMSVKVVTLWKAACSQLRSIDVDLNLAACCNSLHRHISSTFDFRLPLRTSSNSYTGHAFGSWTHNTQKMWFQNRAWIFIYGYELQLHGGNAFKSNTSYFGNTFIQSLNIRDHPSESQATQRRNCLHTSDFSSVQRQAKQKDVKAENHRPERSR